MPRHNRRHRRLQAQMNVVPYIDVMLVLLIIFMITSPMLSLEGVQVELPEVAAQPVQPDALLPVILKITAQNTYLLSDGDFIDRPYTEETLSDLGTYIVAKAKQEPQRPIVLSGDKQVPYGEVLKLMAYLEGNGIKIRLMTRSPPETSSSNPAP